MSLEPTAPLHTRATRWLAQNSGSTFLSADFLLGTGIAVGVGMAAAFHPSIKAQARPVLFFEAGLGVAVLGVVLTGISVLVAFLGEEYIAVLNRTPLGVAGAIRPFKVIALVGGMASLLGLASALFWSSLASWSQTVALAICSDAAVWAVVGTIQLVNITARHGEYRTQLPEIREAFRRGLKERQRRASSN